MFTENQKHLIKRNHKYAACYHDGDLSHIPTKKYALGKSPGALQYRKSLKLTPIVTCMDCRIDPYAAFGISNGDAHVIRNAGGSAREAFRSLVISEQLLETTEIFVIKHTECGAMTTNERIDSVIAKNLGAEAVAELDKIDWITFGDLEQAVKDDVAFLKKSKAIPDSVAVSGWVYDVESGRVRLVV